MADLLSVRMFEPHLDWLAPRLMQQQDIESTLCQWDEEFRESFYSGEEDGEQKVKLSYSNSSCCVFFWEENVALRLNCRFIFPLN